LSENSTSELPKLILAPGTKIVPIRDLPSAYSQKLEAGEDDYAIFRPSGRSTAKVINAELSEFLKQFSEPIGVGSAVLGFANRNGLVADELLEDIFPILKKLVDCSFLLPEEEFHVKCKPETELTSFRNLQIVRPIQLMDDVEIYCAKDYDDRLVALKLAKEKGSVHNKAIIREAELLKAIRGLSVPNLIDHGKEDGRAFLVMEWVPGIPADKMADAIRKERVGVYPWDKLLDLAVAVCKAYAEIHNTDVLHGDIHPRNVLVDNNEKVSIIDFGLAKRQDQKQKKHRGGIGYFYEPEYATARLNKEKPPELTALGEQYSIAVLLYRILTGTLYLSFSLDKETAYQQIAEESPQPFRTVGVEQWPELEVVLARALSKKPEMRYGSLNEFAEALEEVKGNRSHVRRHTVNLNSDQMESFLSENIDRILARGWQFEIPDAPRLSVNMGLAGFAYGLYRIAINRKNPELLALADLIAERANVEKNDPGSFWNQELGMTESMITTHSVFNAVPGVSAVRAFLAHAREDVYSSNLALSEFVDASKGVLQGKLDFTFGKSGTLVVCSNLIKIMSYHSCVETEFLREFGSAVEQSLLSEILSMAQDQSLSGYFGAAHGWAGYLYSILKWRDATREAIPEAVVELLHKLATYAHPVDRGLHWPRKWPTKRPDYLGSWCNGAAGFVHLWLTAFHKLADPYWLSLADSAAWACWDANDQGGDLCCGTAGRAYSLLEHYKATGNYDWFESAVILTQRSMNQIVQLPPPNIGLYKGLTGVLVLISDLTAGSNFTMPFFGDEC
jgi:serine/threonine-protein kinase